MIEQKRFAFSHLPRRRRRGRLAGLLSGNVVKERYRAKKVAEVMTPRQQLITVQERDVAKADPIKEADRFSPSTSASTRCSWSTTRTTCAASSPAPTSSASPARPSPAASRPRRPFPPRRRRRHLAGAQARGELDRDKILAHVGALVDEPSTPSPSPPPTATPPASATS
jgi:IMP dehydrogenase